MYSGYGNIHNSEPWDFTADEVKNPDVGNAVTWALDMLETYHGKARQAEIHTNWASPLFLDPAFTREYCKALYDPENALQYADDEGVSR